MRGLRTVVIALLLMWGSLQLGTQWSATRLSVSTKGPAWVSLMGYQVYRPHQGVVWFVSADDAVASLVFLPTAVSMAGMLAGCLVLRVGLGRGARHRPEQRVSGARWATRNDLKKGGLLG
jgi:hypothetical protein